MEHFLGKKDFAKFNFYDFQIFKIVQQGVKQMNKMCQNMKHFYHAVLC